MFIKEMKKFFWVDKKQDEKSEDYHRRVLALAESRNQSIKYRRNGGSDLGVTRLESDPTKTPLLTVDIQGIPRNWDGEDVASFLKAEKWTEVSIVNRRRAGKSSFRWTVKGKPPGSDKQGPWS